MFRTVFFAALLAPGLALAAGGGTQAPKPSETTQTCTNGEIWDSGSKSCKAPQHSALDDDTLYGAVREFAYAGQFKNAQIALAEMSDQSDDRVLTYWGFTHRKMGDVDTGMAYYTRAIATNPANILARSYMGQALVEQGDIPAAKVQLAAIRQYDGTGTWAEQSLHTAIKSGKTYNY